MEHVSYRKSIAFKHFLQPSSPSSSSSILPEHAVIENEANEHLVLRPLNGARILLNGRTMEEGEEEELHHNDRFVWEEGEGETQTYIMLMMANSVHIHAACRLATVTDLRANTPSPHRPCMWLVKLIVVC